MSIENLQCPKCGGDKLIKRGGCRGKQRHSCKDCHWNGTQPVGLESHETASIPKAGVDKLSTTVKKASKLVLSCAQNATPINERFFASLLGYCRHNKAQLLVIPIRYKNPTSKWSTAAQDDDWWAPELAPYLFDRRVALNQNLMLLADIKSQPTASAPTAGFENISGSSSAIVGHPKIELVSIPTPQNRMAKIVTSTGACTVANYVPSKAGKKGEHHHSFGAVVVELDGSRFHLRHVNAAKNGSFYDLDKHYSGKNVKSGIRAEALVMGDSHIAQIDPNVVKATFTNKDSMVNVLRPKVLVWHDVFDGFSINPHEAKDVFARYGRRVTGRESVEKELKECFDFIDKRTPKGCKAVFPYSNHVDFLRRFVRDTDPRVDLANCVWLAEVFRETCLAIQRGEDLDPFEYEARRRLKCYSHAKFLKMDESYMVGDVEVGGHGHAGPSGTRGSAKAFSKMGTKSVTGHSHSPAIIGGAYVVGTSSKLKLSYNQGPSSWLHCHCAVYPDSKRTLIFVIEGRWRG